MFTFCMSIFSVWYIKEESVCVCVRGLLERVCERDREKYSVIESTLFLELPCEIHCICIWEREPI